MAESGRFPGPTFRLLAAGPQYQCALHQKWGVISGLLVLAVPVPEPHLWWLRPGGGTLEVGGAATTGTTPTWSLCRLRVDAPDASCLPSTVRTVRGRSGSFRGVKTVLLRRREKRGESGLRVSPYLLSVSHTGRCSIDRSRVWAPIEFLRSRQRKHFSSRTRFTCPRAPLMVSRSRGRYVGSRFHYDDGERWVTWLSLFRRAKSPYQLHWMHVTLKGRPIECTSR